MIMEFSSQHMNSKAQFRSFADSEIKPYAGQNDKNEKIPENMLKALGKNGYLGSMLPKTYGGLEMDMITIGILNEEIGMACSSTRSLITVQGMVALAILKWGTQSQKDKWLPQLAAGEAIGAFGLTEPDVGSDAKNIQSEAIICGNNYILNGVKKWITFGQIADVFLIFARCEGKPSAFLLPKDCQGLTVKPITGLLGLRASMGAEIIMNNCMIPKENLIGAIGTGISHVAAHSLDYGRYTVAWGCVGIGQACLEESVLYATTRKQFDSKLIHFQLIQKMIAEMTVKIDAARLLCCKAGYLKGIGSPDSIMETCNAKYFSSTMLQQIVSDSVQIHGANGCSSNICIERHFRDAKVMEIIEGTNQIQERLIATNLFRVYN